MKPTQKLKIKNKKAKKSFNIIFVYGICEGGGVKKKEMKWGGKS